jgi:hypothetical protein
MFACSGHPLALELEVFLLTTDTFCRLLRPVAAACCLAAAMLPAGAQSYRNVVNTRFRTVSNGPLSAMIVDVPDPTDRSAVRSAVMKQVAQHVASRRTALAPEIAAMRRRGMIHANDRPDIVDTVIVRSGGQLMVPKPQGITRAGNSLTFTAPTSGDGAWSATDANTVTQLASSIYPLLQQVIGAPAWSGTVAIKSLDPTVNTQNEVIGAVLVINSATDIEIDLPTFSSAETEYLALTQAMAQAFHGPARIAYDAWEIGMARAAAVVVAKLTNNANISPANGFYFTAEYDLLNEPPLGNSTFEPASAAHEPFNAGTLSGMLIPRLQMSSTAWLKCYIEDPKFFISFNATYYSKWNTDPTVSNSISDLTEYAADALQLDNASNQVELTPFPTWYQQQYVLDTSVTVGPKLYVYATPTFPQTGATPEPGGAAIYNVYYSTSATGDETNLSGNLNVIYWDYTYQNRLDLPTFGQVQISNGFGSVAPFFQNIGGNPADTMRVAMDFPIANSYERVCIPSNETGTDTAPNDFQGVVLGSNAGTLTVQYDGGSGVITTQVQQGSFGAAGQSGAVPSGFSKAHITYSPSGGTPINFQRNTAFNNSLGVQQIWVLTAPGPTNSLAFTIQTGPQMISLPIQPLKHDIAADLGVDPSKALIAQYRQDQSNPDNYMRYPNLPLYQPGYGLWTNLATAVNGNIVGVPTDTQPTVSVALQYGWNQIGPPFSSAPLNVTSDVTFQYLGGDVLNLTDAISRGWVAAGIIGYSSAHGYYDITGTPPSGVPLNILEIWKGYWINVLVTEGVTMTYTNPNATQAEALKRAALKNATRAAAPAKLDGWRLPIMVEDANGHGSIATLGQASKGANRYVAALDVANPPSFGQMAALTTRFVNTAWQNGSATGTYLSDVRPLNSASSWNMVVNIPMPGQTYKVTWGATALLPRGTMLTITDQTTGTRLVMNHNSSLSFTPGTGETSRTFVIAAQPGAIGRLSLSNVTVEHPLVAGGRASSAITVSFQSSGAATLNATIMNGGRVIRHLQSGRAITAGANRLVWDSRDDAGRQMAAGAYTVEISAMSEQGDLTRSITPIVISR